MREIKFRAWEKTSESMVYDVQNVSRKRIIGESACESFQEVVDSWEYETMQYTGLKDKSGVEIYEEDNVRYPHIRSFKDVWQVKFHNGSFVIKQGNILICIRDLAYKSNLEVIGNIYENPELLEGEE